MKTKKIAPWLVVCLIAVAGCGKDDTFPDDGTPLFKPADFEIVNIDPTQDDYYGGDVYVGYDVKNVSGRDYEGSTTVFFDIRWTVKTTDGTLYHTLRGMPDDLLKDAVSSESVIIDLSPGKTADLSSLTYEVIVDE